MRKRVALFYYPVGVGDARGDHFEEMKPLVDTGALYSQLPASILERLGHRPNASRRFRLADGSVISRPIGSVPFRIDGETRTTVCIFGEEESQKLLGAVTLEEFSLAPDPVSETLTPVIASLMAL